MSSRMENQTVKKEKSRWCVRPSLDVELVVKIAADVFGLIVEKNSVKELPSYDDQNFLVKGSFQSGTTDDGSLTNTAKYVMKVYNAEYLPRKPELETLCEIVTSCCKKERDDAEVSLPMRSLEDNLIEAYEIPLSKNYNVEPGTNMSILKTCNGQYVLKHLVRLAKFVPGNVIEKGDVISDILAYDVGRKAAQLTIKLQESDIPRFNTAHRWNLMLSHQYLPEPYISSLENVELRNMCEDILSQFKQRVLPHVVDLPKQLIHGDLNNLNILQNDASTQVVGIIDFDDMHDTCRVAEIAIALAYFTCIGSKDRCLTTAKNVFSGYSSLISLNETELEVLYVLVLLRYSACISIGSYTLGCVASDNEYTDYHLFPARNMLPYLYALGQKRFMAAITGCDTELLSE